MADQEHAESGDPIYRYKDVQPKGFTPAIGDSDNIEAISAHIEKHVGKIEIVFHEVVSHLVHIDIHWVKPTTAFPYHTLVTSGMSDKAMNVPEAAEAYRYAELCIFLPKDWIINGELYQTTEDAFEDENNYWPIRWLKKLARFPHEYDTWIGYGHTIPNGENTEPFANNTKFGCMILFPGLSIDAAFSRLRINDEKTIQIYCLYPLYKEEMELKLKQGSDALIDRFQKFRVRDIVDIKRPNTCAKKKTG